MALDHDLIRSLVQPTPQKILCLLLDGVGGLQHPDHDNRTELEAAVTPHLDALAARGVQGLADPVAPGITPGSGPGHLALFGYDPTDIIVGRGVLSALGVDFDLTRYDVAARINFCTLDADGIITDRRAGRIADEPARVICAKLEAAFNELTPHAEIFVPHVREHRAALIVRMPGGRPEVSDTDPQTIGVAPLPMEPTSRKGKETAALLRQLLDCTREVLKDEPLANFMLLRGYATLPRIEPFPAWTGMRAKAFAEYPMYRGLARLIGMDVQRPYTGVDDGLALLREHWDTLDYAFFHYKPTDSAGEDGNFEGKVAAIEAFDTVLPQFLELAPDVVIVTADHSTPARLAGHSWHPVPVLLVAEHVRRDNLPRFTETHARQGALGRFRLKELLVEAMACAGKLAKFGA